MAVHINQNNTATEPTSTQSPMDNVFRNPNQQPQQPKTTLFSNFTSPIRTGLITNTVLEKFRKEFESFELQSGYERKIYFIDNMVEPNFVFSTIVIGLTKDNHTVAVPIIVEASGNNVPALYENISGRQVEIFRTTSDAFDPVMGNKIKEMVSSGGGRYTLLDGIVYYKEANPEDRFTILKVLFNAIELIGAEFSLMAGIDISAEPVKQKLAIETQFGKVTVSDYLLPKRGDIGITLSIDGGNSQQQSRFLVNTDSSRNESICRTSAYVDFMYAPGMNLANPNPILHKKCFVGNYIITSIRPKTITPASIMLGLISSLTVLNDNMWLNSLKPGFNNSDIGYLNIQGNVDNDPKGVGEVIDTSIAKFSVGDMMKLVQLLVHDRLMVSIDIDHHSELYSGMSFLESAAIGKRDAINVIIKACDSLTNGNFSKFFNPGNVIFVNSERMHLGYYYDNNRVMQDIRNMDYLKIAEILGPKNIDVINQYNTTFTKNIDAWIRLEQRKKILEMVTNGDLHIKGWTDRLTFSAEFINALTSAVATQGVVFKAYQRFSNDFIANNYAQYFNNAMVPSVVPVAQQAPSAINPYWGGYRWG